MLNKHTNRHSTSNVIRKLQIKQISNVISKQNRDTDIERKRMDTKQAGRMGWVRIDIYTIDMMYKIDN